MPRTLPLVGCLCVSAGRVPIIPIAMWSYQHQTYKNSTMLIKSHVPEYKVLEALDDGCLHLFDMMHCEYVAIWDDDDYSPTDRLALSVEALLECNAHAPALASYPAGWFCNLLTLKANFIDVQGVANHLWGGGLMFNLAAYKALGGFRGASWPGQDRELQEAVRRTSGLLIPLEDCDLPVAFVHGKNISSKMYSAGDATLEVAAPTMPADVKDAVRAAQAFLRARGAHVPAPEV